jgi:hypothetical protein
MPAQPVDLVARSRNEIFLQTSFTRTSPASSKVKIETRTLQRHCSGKITERRIPVGTLL